VYPSQVTRGGGGERWVIGTGREWSTPVPMRHAINGESSVRRGLAASTTAKSMGLHDFCLQMSEPLGGLMCVISWPSQEKTEGVEGGEEEEGQSVQAEADLVALVVDPLFDRWVSPLGSSSPLATMQRRLQVHLISRPHKTPLSPPPLTIVC